RSVRVAVERGSIPYSAVTQPLPVLRRKGGTRSSTEAVHSTCVSPNFVRHEPSAYLATPGSRLTGRIASRARPEGRRTPGPGHKLPTRGFAAHRPDSRRSHSPKDGDGSGRRG